MGKGRRRPRGQISRILSQDEVLIANVLKRLHRRVAAGQNVPFLVATIEPKQLQGMSEPIAEPIVASRGIMDNRLGPLRQKLTAHLLEIGFLKEKPKDEEIPSELEHDLEG